MENLVRADRNQACLLPPDSRKWLPEDDLTHFVVEAVERVPLSQFQLNTRGTGAAQYSSRMMPALLIYCYANGIFSSADQAAHERKVRRARSVPVGPRSTVSSHPRRLGWWRCRTSCHRRTTGPATGYASRPWSSGKLRVITPCRKENA